MVHGKRAQHAVVVVASPPDDEPVDELLPHPATVKAPAKDDLPVWGKPADWNDYSGTADGKVVGVAVFDHPKNPQANWHVRAYGLNAANPFGRAHSGFPSQKDSTDLLKIAKGGEMKLKYAVYAHDGDAKSGKVAEAFAEFKK